MGTVNKGCVKRVDDGCPPPRARGTTPTPKTVTMKTLVHALDEIEQWAGSVRNVLQQLPPGMTVEIGGKKKTAKRKTAKKKAKRKTR